MKYPTTVANLIADRQSNVATSRIFVMLVYQITTSTTVITAKMTATLM